MVSLTEVGRRVASRWSHRLHSLPILALTSHSACNCRCVMCDIWKANADKREITRADLERHVDAIRRLRVQRVMLTGGEPLLHSNLWGLCDLLQADGIRVTLVTTGLLIEAHAGDIARVVDEVVVSVDGPSDVHDEIRRVRGGFERIRRGLRALRAEPSPPRVTARTVVQRQNHARLVQTIDAIRALDVDRLSFLAADVSSPAFNRPEPWSLERRAEVALAEDQILGLAAAIGDVETHCRTALERGFIVGGTASLWRIHAHYRALAGDGAFPRVRCTAPWTSAVLEPDGRVRPCFFHVPYDVAAGGDLESALNAPAAIAFRASLDVASNPTCRRCVCSLNLPVWRDA